MNKRAGLIGLVIMFSSLFAFAQNPPDYEKNWHQWRGPYMMGTSPDGDPPLEWSETKNIKWKLTIPGKGHSTPIIWEDQIFILTAVETDNVARPSDPNTEQQSRRGPPSRKTSNVHKFVVLSVDQDSGNILWQRTVKEELPEERTHELGSWASNSPVTDGEYVYAYFGSRGLFCLDMKGNLKWERDFGQLNKRMEFGEGSSPALYGNKIIINWDHEGQSFIIALDKKTGEEIWKTARDEGTTWATPLVVEYDGKHQVITPASKLVRSYDLETGKLIWELGGLTSNCIPMPVVVDDIVIVMSGHRGFSLMAIDLSKAQGNISDSDAIVWKLDRDTPYTPSPVLYEGKLYFLKSNNGIFSCFDAKTGKEYYSKQRLEGMGGVYSSPVATQDRIYIVGLNGTTYVVRHGPEFEILTKNTLNDKFNASPVVVGKQIFLRGNKNLYCIEE